MKSQKFVLTALLLAGFIFCFLITGVEAQTEKILNYHSYIVIHEDGTMTVTETIKVVCAGQESKRGIFRTFPTKYKDRYGNTVRVGFDVSEVMKNGKPEPYFTEDMRNGVKVYIGDRDVYLSPGEYTYTLVYKTDHQLGFFDDFDELYWNVTGLDWGFEINKAEAVVQLPAGADVISTAAYTGPRGAQGKDFTIGTDYSGNVRFTTTRPLMPHEGLTIAVSFTKGIIPEPSVMDKTGFLLKNNKAAGASLIGFCLLFFYYILAWSKVGKDPAKGTIMPRFKPPDGYSPAATRYVMRMGYSNRVFAAAIVDMAVKGYVTIKEEKGKYELLRTNVSESVLSNGEKKIAAKLFSKYDRQIEFKQTNHATISSAIQALKKDLKLNFEKMNFRHNASYLAPGIIITILTLVAVVIYAPVKEGAGFLAIWLSGWTAGCLALLKGTLTGWKAVFSRGGFKAGNLAAVMGVTMFALPFFFFELAALVGFAFMASFMAALFFLLLITLNFIFYNLLKAPTIHGRKIMDLIEGFKMYLSTAEEERLNLLNPPDKTPELFEKYLPYALALDVENDWSDKFADVLAKASAKQGYSPSWYSGRSWNTLGTSGLVSSLGASFSSAISSSSTAPGSSSGSGGGGSSGGGGGGGGGGGW